jgi:hypothetical protein
MWQPIGICEWCGGCIKSDSYCLHCGRSDDISYEISVYRFQLEHEKDFRNWHVYGTWREYRAPIKLPRPIGRHNKYER